MPLYSAIHLIIPVAIFPVLSKEVIARPKNNLISGFLILVRFYRNIHFWSLQSLQSLQNTEEGI